MNLIIVESPTKARTLSRFLGKDYIVEATVGHIKDLPKSPISIDIANGFTPDYQVVPKQQKTIATLKKAAKSASRIYLATDPDREGEAISAHVKEILSEDGVKGDIKRIVFHEITKEAVEDAIEHPRLVDAHLVDAQVARRVLDRLVGYKVSPILWKKVRLGLSAGRVQTVAVRLIVERERDIREFKPVEYWEIASEVKKDDQNFLVSLLRMDDKNAVVSNKEQADAIVADLKNATHIVLSVKRAETKKSPYPPFTTSTMSQAAARIFGWSAKRTMTVAQHLYEEGLITYHRTDSTNLSQQAISEVRGFIQKEYGESYLPEHERVYKKKSKNAQEAHEAIRPTHVATSKEVALEKLDVSAEKLYELIWKRFVACQMAQSVYDRTTIDVGASKYLLRATGQIMKFDGWRKVMPMKMSDDEIPLPSLIEGETLALIEVHSDQKFTQPPARYNEASLIKQMEALGIGRPSTYAPTISTIVARQYVEKQEGKFFTTPVGETVNDFLLSNFDGIFEYQFTAGMEDDLDKIARGELSWRDRMQTFWEPFAKELERVEKTAERVKIPVEKIGEPCPLCGESDKGEKVIRVGRFGKFISCSRFPDCKFTDRFVEKINMECPKCGTGEVIIKKTKKGRTFFGCSRYPDCDYASWKNPQKSSAESE
ncbi:DNA topoisomerase I [Candidatus Woesebacteria bacterium RIFCSPHIGHO2_01_FULL_41_10]|uniref:DNA topoisomerase 1 n=1 Tax=Candidatus Woesebacteria bacterium RIFCSPHIGHO2_01_FULL_41_10 TaxID=1802500 RepID=A0A1F7YRC2_9BACT|nr:MAG: DNA topoisomerase I [Candidatus Woesebacteria bacterium RIFCSPHIGHO2_01_FULL_41_10]